MKLIPVMLFVSIAAIVAAGLMAAQRCDARAATVTAASAPETVGSVELLVDWGTLPNGLMVYKDEARGYWVYVCAKGYGSDTSPPTCSVFAVPIPKK